MKRSTYEEPAGAQPPESVSPIQPKLLPKEYLGRKRFSREEFLRDKHRIFQGMKKGPKSRKSTSPNNRGH